MKLEAFATLDAVIRCGSMTGAATEMNITLGAVSLQMKQLESYLGQPLFDRSGRSPQPTALAINVAAVMSKASAELNVMRRSRTTVASGTFRLGVIESMQPVLLPEAFVQLRKRHPLVQLKPARGKAAELLQAVKAGELDAAVIRQPPSKQSSRLDWVPLMRRELKLIAPPSSQETNLHQLLEKHDLITLDRGTVMGDLAMRYLQEHCGKWRNILEFDGLPTIVAMVSAGVGIGLVVLPDSHVDRLYPVRVLRLPNAPVLQFSLVNRVEQAEDRLLLAVKEALVLAAADKSEEEAITVKHRATRRTR